MAFEYTIENAQTLQGNTRIVYGTWNLDSVTTGELPTGLGRVDSIVISHTGTAIEERAAVVNETLPLSSGTVTLVGTSGDKGTFIAIGQ